MASEIKKRISAQGPTGNRPGGVKLPAAGERVNSKKSDGGCGC
jgi:hypothetical protein